MTRITPIICVSLISVLAAGCFQSEPANEKSTGGQPAAGGGSAGADSSPKAYSLSDLQIQPGSIPLPLDNGKLTAFPPEGWDFGRPGGGELVGFFPEGASLNSLPRIFVSADDSPYPDFRSVDPTNVIAFAKAVNDGLDTKTLAEPARPVILNGNAFARYVEYRRQGKARIAVQYLLTVNSGRLYSIRLQVLEPQFRMHRDAGYAVGASISFSEPGPTEANSANSGPAFSEAGTATESATDAPSSAEAPAESP